MTLVEKTHLDFVFSALQKAPLHDLASTDANGSLSTDSTDLHLQLDTLMVGPLITQRYHPGLLILVKL